jgi:hypothetical protein
VTVPQTSTPHDDNTTDNQSQYWAGDNHSTLAGSETAALARTPGRPCPNGQSLKSGVHASETQEIRHHAVRPGIKSVPKL